MPRAAIGHLRRERAWSSPAAITTCRRHVQHFHDADTSCPAFAGFALNSGPGGHLRRLPRKRKPRDVEEACMARTSPPAIRRAACTDCHSEHRIEGSRHVAARFPSICSKCHASERLNTNTTCPPTACRPSFKATTGWPTNTARPSPPTAPVATGSADPAVQRRALDHQFGAPRRDLRQMPSGRDRQFCRGQDPRGRAGRRENSRQHDTHGELINWWVRRPYLGLIVGVIGGPCILTTSSLFWPQEAGRHP